MNYFTEKLTRIVPTSGYRVRVEFQDGFAAELDLSPLLDEGPIFAPLRGPDFFSLVRIDCGAAVWSEVLDLAPGSVRAWAESGRVLSQDETDEWLEEHDEAANINVASGAHAAAFGS